MLRPPSPRTFPAWLFPRARPQRTDHEPHLDRLDSVRRKGDLEPGLATAESPFGASIACDLSRLRPIRSVFVALSGDGSHIVFTSSATNLVSRPDLHGGNNVYIERTT